MKITVRVTPSARRLLIKEDDGVLKVAPEE